MSITSASTPKCYDERCQTADAYRLHNGLNSNGGNVSLKKPGQQRRQGVTEKGSAATEPRWLWCVLMMVLLVFGMFEASGR